MMYPTDFTFWEKLKAFVDYEPVESITPELRGVLASIGIVRGQPFKPTAGQRALLTRAVEQAPKMILAWRLGGRADGRDLYYPDRKYLRAWAAQPPSGCRTAISTWTSAPPSSRLPTPRRRRW